MEGPAQSDLELEGGNNSAVTINDAGISSPSRAELYTGSDSDLVTTMPTTSQTILSSGVDMTATSVLLSGSKTTTKYSTDMPSSTVHDEVEGDWIDAKDLEAAERLCSQLFQDFGADRNGMLTRDQLHLLISTVFYQVGIDLALAFTIDDSELALRAFDIHGKGAVRQSDFIAWTIRGLRRSPQERQEFASATQLSQKMDKLLTAIHTLAATFRRSTKMPTSSPVKKMLKKNVKKNAKKIVKNTTKKKRKEEKQATIAVKSRKKKVPAKGTRSMQGSRKGRRPQQSTAKKLRRNVGSKGSRTSRSPSKRSRGEPKSVRTMKSESHEPQRLHHTSRIKRKKNDSTKQARPINRRIKIEIPGPPKIERVSLAAPTTEDKSIRETKLRDARDGMSINGRPRWVPLGSFSLRSRRNEDADLTMPSEDGKPAHTFQSRREPTASPRVWLPSSPSPSRQERRSLSPSRRRRSLSPSQRSRSVSPSRKSSRTKKSIHSTQTQKVSSSAAAGNQGAMARSPSALKLVRLESPNENITKEHGQGTQQKSPMRYRRVQKNHLKLINRVKSMPVLSSTSSSSASSSSSALSTLSAMEPAASRFSTKSAAQNSHFEKNRNALKGDSPSSSASVTAGSSSEYIQAQKARLIKKAKSMVSLSKLKDESIRLIFKEFDTDGDGHIDIKELKKLVKTIPNRMKIKISGGGFKKADLSRLMKAFDTDGNGTIEMQEFVDWVKNGLKLSKEERAAFARHTPMSAKLSDLLASVEKYIGFRVERQMFLARQAAKKLEADHEKMKKEEKKKQKKLGKKTMSAMNILRVFRSSKKTMESQEENAVPSKKPVSGSSTPGNKLDNIDNTAESRSKDSSSLNKGDDDNENVNSKEKPPSNAKLFEDSKKKKKEKGERAIKAAHKPLKLASASLSTTSTTDLSAVGLSNQIYFDFRSLNYGNTVIRTATRKTISLVNDSELEIIATLSLPPGKGFQIIFPANCPATEKEAFQKFHIQPRSRLLIPVRFRPLLLGTSVCSLVSKVVIVQGKTTLRAVCALEGKGI